MVEFQGAAGPTAGTGGTDGSDGGTAGEQALPPVCLGCGAELACATKGIPRGYQGDLGCAYEPREGEYSSTCMYVLLEYLQFFMC